MRHAGTGALEQLAPLLNELRGLAKLRERGTGVFYRGGAATLHFHEDPSGLYADLKQGRDWVRYAVNTPEQRAAVLKAAESLA